MKTIKSKKRKLNFIHATGSKLFLTFDEKEATYHKKQLKCKKIKKSSQKREDNKNFNIILFMLQVQN